MGLLIILSLRTLHNLSTISATEAPQELRLDGGALTALYTLNAGMNKPAILNGRGDALVEFSGWDSFVSVDGVSADLWSHAFNIELDRARDRAFLTWSSVPLRQDDPGQEGHHRRYQLEQVVTLLGPRTVVEYYIIPNEPVRTVDLTVGAYKWYLRDLRHEGDTFSFLSADLTRQDAERRLQPGRLTQVTVRSLVPAVGVRPLVNQFGAYALDFSYEVAQPRTYERTLVARLEVTEGPRGPAIQP